MNRPFLQNLKTALLWIILLPIVGTTYLVVWLDRKLKFPLPFPRDVNALAEQKDWCINELKKNGVLPADAVIDDYKVTPLNQTIIFRSNAGVLEIKYSSGGVQQSLKCFAKFAPTMGTVWNKTIFNLQLNHIKEGNFNNYFAKVDDIPAPKVYCSVISANTGHLCLITEHMSDCMEYLETVYEVFPQHHLDLALEGMATLHARYWMGIVDNTNTGNDRMKYVLPIEDSTVYLMDSIVASSWSIAARKILEKSWCLMNEQQTVVHGDARIGNMMFPSSAGKGRFVLIDWQAVRKGTGVYDLAYFLILSLHSEHRKQVEQQSIDTYYRHLVAKGVRNCSREELEDDYKHACLCVMVLLSLPLLSGEVSVEDKAAMIFAWGMGVWRQRLQDKFEDFDYAWFARNYSLTETEAKNAVTEMLSVIEARLKLLYSGSHAELEAEISRMKAERG